MVLFLALAGLSLAARWLSLAVDVIDIDETAHIVGSWTLLRGGTLYLDFVDNKPPLLYVAYALAQLACGRTLPGVHLFTAGVVVPMTALALVMFHGRNRAGLVAAVTFVVYGSAFLAHDMLATNAEVLMQWPAAWALVLMRNEDALRSRWRPCAAGALLAAGILIKFQVATWALALAVAVAVSGWRRRIERGTAIRALVLCAFGAAIVAAGVAAWLAASGALHPFFYWTIANNINYTENPVPWSEALQRGAGALIPFVLVTAPLWVGAWKQRPSAASPYREWLAAAVVLASIPPVFLGWRFFPHYLIQLYVPLSLAAAPWIAARLASWRTARMLVWQAAIVLVACQVVNAWLYFGDARVYRERDPVYRAISTAVATAGCGPDATLFVWGYAPMVYYYSHLRPASRFAVLAQSRLTDYVAGNLAALRGEADARAYADPTHWAWLMDDLERSKATYIVDTAPARLYRWNRYPLEEFPVLSQYVAKHFERAAVVDQVVVYKRVGCGMFRESQH